ncbi:hypothetical protein ACVB8X_13995 [Streptomyces sp. NRAIS4]
MAKSATITVTVSTELADAFEGHAHLLAPVTLVGRTQAGPCWWTYYLHHPSAPPGAATVTPVYCRSADGTVSLSHLDWYDAAGHALPAPAAHAPVH